MKKFIFIILICLLVSPVMAKDCIECPRDNPCPYTFPAGDGCNTCSGSIWCKDGKWYTDYIGVQCTLLACHRVYEIPNPFQKEDQK